MTELDQTLPSLARGRRKALPLKLDSDSVRAAYARWARSYDIVFGAVSREGRRRAVAAVNALPGELVLEVGVGTGLALPHYAGTKRVTGIDLSPHMLARAAARTESLNLRHVERLVEMDAEATDFEDGQFDIAVAMFVASVVPDARRLLGELKRVVRAGGHILFVNHFLAESGVRRPFELALAGGARALGWHPDFALSSLLGADDRARADIEAVPPLGLFTLLKLVNLG